MSRSHTFDRKQSALLPRRSNFIRNLIALHHRKPAIIQTADRPREGDRDRQNAKTQRQQLNTTNTSISATQSDRAWEIYTADKKQPENDRSS